MVRLNLRSHLRRYFAGISTGVMVISLMRCGPANTPATEARTAVAITPRGPAVGHIGAQPVTLAELQSFADQQSPNSRAELLETFSAQRLLALEAIARGQNSDPIVLDVARRAMVQRLLEIEIEQRVGPHNIPEGALNLARKTKGFALAHGPLNHVVHVLALCPPADAAVHCDESAQQRAEAARVALVASSDRHDLAAIQRTVASLTAGSEYRVEAIDGFDEHGNDGTPGGFDSTFAAAAQNLAAPGDVSPVTRTPFGYHVLVLIRRDPALAADPVMVAREVQSEALNMVRTRAMRAFMEHLRQRHHVRLFDATGEAQPNRAGGNR